MSSELAWKLAEIKAKKFQVFFFLYDLLFLPDQLLIARKYALEKTQLSDVLITDNLFW